MNYAHIHELQQQDEQLLALQVKYPDNYINLQLDDDIDDIICYKKDPTQPNWKIVLPESMVVDTVKWFHQVMGHPGEKRLQETLNQHYYHPRLCYHMDELKFSAKAAKVIAKLYHHGKGNAFHHCNSQRILRYAPRCEHPCFYGS